MPNDSDARVLVVGGGPAGLATAACLKRDGVPFAMVDRDGKIGGAYRNMYSATELLSPAKFTQLPGLPIDADTQYINAGQYHDYLHQYANHHELSLIQATVEEISKAPGRGLEVRFRSRPSTKYDAVVLATGIVRHPVNADIEGLQNDGDSPKVIHSRDWQGCDGLAGQRVLVVGGGMSGVEIAEQCAQSDIAVTVSVRSPIRLWRRRLLGIDVHHFVHLFSHRLPRWVTGTYCRKLPALGAFDRGFRKFHRAGKIQQRVGIERFCTDLVRFRDGQTDCFDLVVLATGYRWHPPCLPSDVKTGDAGHPIARHAEIPNYRGLYVVGAPCARILPSEFLHGINHDAPFVSKSIASRLADSRLKPN